MVWNDKIIFWENFFLPTEHILNKYLYGINRALLKSTITYNKNEHIFSNNLIRNNQKSKNEYWWMMLQKLQTPCLPKPSQTLHSYFTYVVFNSNIVNIICSFNFFKKQTIQSINHRMNCDLFNILKECYVEKLKVNYK